MISKNIFIGTVLPVLPGDCRDLAMEVYNTAWPTDRSEDISRILQKAAELEKVPETILALQSISIDRAEIGFTLVKEMLELN